MTAPITDEEAMRQALDLARRGIGAVEPNPAVGAVIASEEGNVVGEGWHEKFGGPHAEVMALAAAGVAARGSTLYVTLEPCSHFGKTPPCSKAVIAAGIRRVVISAIDPANHGSTGGINELRAAGIDVEVGLMKTEGEQLIAPFSKLMTRNLPWVHAKWAMTLDGRIASGTGSSKWITNEESRKFAHVLRGRMDGILAGIGTVLADDPLLTARPHGQRVAHRIVLDSNARTPLTSQLVRTIDDAPVIIFVSESAPDERVDALKMTGVEVITTKSTKTHSGIGVDPKEVLHELGHRRLTNLLIEGGSKVLGQFFDLDLIDEIHAFIAPKLIGGASAPGPIGGRGIDVMSNATQLCDVSTHNISGDLYLNARIKR